MADPRWQLLQDAKPLLLDVLAEQGVNRIEYVAAFPIGGVVVWLGTATDSERDALGNRNPLRAEVREILVDVGLRDTDLKPFLTTAQSQETVDRDYAGSWFYALR